MPNDKFKTVAENIFPKLKKNNSKEAKGKLDAPDKLKVLFTIVDREKTQFYLDVLEGYDVNFQTVLYGKGTADSSLYGKYLSASPSKSIIISVVREDRVKEILSNYEDKYFKTKHGSGIGFTVKMSSLIGVNLYKFLSDQRGEEIL